MRILLTGGSACGKSTYAEALAMRFSLPRYYIATMRVFGEEGQKKVDQHRKMREAKTLLPSNAIGISEEFEYHRTVRFCWNVCAI